MPLDVGVSDNKHDESAKSAHVEVLAYPIFEVLVQPIMSTNSALAEVPV